MNLFTKLLACCPMETPSDIVMGSGTEDVVSQTVRAYSKAYSTNMVVTATSTGVSPHSLRYSPIQPEVLVHIVVFAVIVRQGVIVHPTAPLRSAVCCRSTVKACSGLFRTQRLTVGYRSENARNEKRNTRSDIALALGP